MLGLCCCMWAFSSCDEQGYSFLGWGGLLLIVVHRLLIVASCCKAQALGTPASVVAAHMLSSCSLQSLDCGLSS